MKATTLVALGFCLAAVSAQAQVTSERLTNAARDPQQWMTYAGAYDGSRFSPLDQINRTNLNRLALQWVFQTRVRGSHETTPPQQSPGFRLRTSAFRLFRSPCATPDHSTPSNPCCRPRPDLAGRTSPPA